MEKYAVAGAIGDDAAVTGSDPETGIDSYAPISGVDTPFVCTLALLAVRLGMGLVYRGSRLLSQDHPARLSYATASRAWTQRTRMMPWRGFHPTSSKPISLTQTAWVVVALFAIDLLLHFLGLPHVHLFGSFEQDVPHLTVRLVQHHAAGRASLLR